MSSAAIRRPGPLHYVGYTCWLLGQVVLAGVDIMRRALSRNTGFEPLVVRYRLRVRDPRLVTALSTSITMTPGTLSLGLRDPDDTGAPQILLVHAVVGGDPESILDSIAAMEARLYPPCALKEEH